MSVNGFKPRMEDNSDAERDDNEKDGPAGDGGASDTDPEEQGDQNMMHGVIHFITATTADAEENDDGGDDCDD